MQPAIDDIVAVAQTIGQTMLAAEFEHAPLDPPLAGHDRLTGCVQITGAWTGAVVVDCSTPFAHLAAERLLGMAPQAASDEDLRDTVAEFANMVGGNVKSLLPGPSFLSLPSVAAGDTFDFRVHRTHRLCDIPLRMHNHPLTITVLQVDREKQPL